MILFKFNSPPTPTNYGKSEIAFSFISIAAKPRWVCFLKRVYSYLSGFFLTGLLGQFRHGAKTKGLTIKF